MLATLRFLTGPLKHKSYQVENSAVCRIGRGPDCDVVLDAADVSREHARLFWEDDSLVVEDVRSTNGVDVNGYTAVRSKLRLGDTVAMGSSAFRVEAMVLGFGETTINDARDTEVPIGEGEGVPLDESRRLSGEFRDFITAMQVILTQHKEAMIEESLRILARILPVSRLSLVKVNDGGELEQGITVAGKGQADTTVSQTFARHVLEAHQPIIVQDAQQLNSEEWGNTIDKQHVRSIMGVPVHSHGSVVAILVADNVEEPRQFSQTHLRQLLFVSKIVEIAFQQEAFVKLDILSDFLPICASCKRIRDDKGYWEALESYFHAHADVQFSHTMCPECLKKHYPDLYDKAVKGAG